jgi:probable biosynthetic protein (TIGR04098 family)
MWAAQQLTVGLPQTNAAGLSEPRLLMEAGHAFWTSLGAMIRQPVSRLRDAAGRPVYATIYFLDVRLPADRPLASFGLDDRLEFRTDVRAVGAMATEARVLVDRADRFSPDEDAGAAWQAGETHPAIWFGSLFAAVDPARHELLLCRPANAALDELPAAEPEASPSRLVRRGQDTGSLEVIPPSWQPVGLDPVTARYALDPDRDTNIAGLVYFANYVAFLQLGERAALAASGRFGPPAEVQRRQLLHRRIAYYANAQPDDELAVTVRVHQDPGGTHAGLRFDVRRASDGRRVCLAEAVFRMPATSRAPHAHRSA